jgi:hypothetical protein
MRPRWSSTAVAAVMVSVLAMLVPSTAYAHKQLNITGYDVEVGWSAEPAFVGQLNSVQVLATSKKNGAPLVQLGGVLKVEVIHGKTSVIMPMEPHKPGDLRAWLVPGAKGAYTFHLLGRIGSQAVDVSATSGPGSFDPVQNPVTIPAVATASVVGTAQTSGGVGSPAAASGPTMSSTTTTVLTLIAIVMGVLGMIGGVLAFVHISREH